jgi:anti-anti-sigma factor
VDDSSQPTPSAEVDFVAEEVAVVTVRGEHDLSKRSILEAALAQSHNHRYVLVDLSCCNFMDSTTLALLLNAHRKHSERDGRLELVIPNGSHPIARLATLMQVQALITTHPSRGAALASFND